MYDESLKKKVKGLSRQELETLCVNAIYHLRCVSGSRNSFSSAQMERWAKDGHYGCERDPLVEAMHMNAVLFLDKEDV